jgi:hypothetical protein
MKQKYFRQFTFKLFKFKLLIVGIYFSIILLLKQNLSKSFFFLVFTHIHLATPLMTQRRRDSRSLI